MPGELSEALTWVHLWAATPAAHKYTANYMLLLAFTKSFSGTFRKSTILKKNLIKLERV